MSNMEDRDVACKTLRHSKVQGEWCGETILLEDVLQNLMTNLLVLKDCLVH